MAKLSTISLERKKELEQPDEFLSLSSRLIQLSMAHKEKLLGGVTAVVVLCVLILGYRYFSARAEAKAVEMLSKETSRYNEAMTSKGPAEALQAVQEQFNLLIDKHGGTMAGKIARIKLADMLFKAGQYDQAIQHFQEAGKNFSAIPSLQDVVNNGLGCAYEAKGDLPKALEYFQLVADNKEGTIQDEALFHLGIIHAEMGDKEKSRAAFKAIIDNHPDSMYLPIAKELSA